MEFLKEALGDELYAQVEAKLKGNEKVKLANLAGGEYVSKDKYNAAVTEVEGLKATIAQTEKQLEQLKTVSGKDAELKGQIEEMQRKHSEEKKALEERLAAQAFDSALEFRLRDSKARNTKAVKALLDLEKIKLDGDKLIGFDEQVKEIRDQNGFLFGEEVPSGAGGAPAAKPQGEPASAWTDFNFTPIRSDK